LVKIGATTSATEGFTPELLAVALFQGERPQDLGEDPFGLLADGDFSGKPNEMALLYGQQGPAPRLLLVGLGAREAATPETLRRAAATVARRARTLELREAALRLPTLPEADTREAARAAAEGAALGLYRFVKHQSAANGHELETFWLVADEGALEDARDGAEIGEKVARGAALARDLANEPSNVATPEYLAQRAREIAEKYGMNLQVLDRAGIEAEGLTGLATVGRSASNEPRFIVLEHRRGGDTAPVVLVGKAVTFDSGGISIKPSAGMEDMKFDMSGGAAVLGAMEAVGATDLPLDVVALVPATENLGMCWRCTRERRWRSSPPTPRGASSWPTHSPTPVATSPRP
jgi:leucyl aminopeptidase